MEGGLSQIQSHFRTFCQATTTLVKGPLKHCLQHLKAPCWHAICNHMAMGLEMKYLRFWGLSLEYEWLWTETSSVACDTSEYSLVAHLNSLMLRAALKACDPSQSGNLYQSRSQQNVHMPTSQQDILFLFEHIAAPWVWVIWKCMRLAAKIHWTVLGWGLLLIWRSKHLQILLSWLLCYTG